MIRQIDAIKFPNDWINTKISAIGKVFKGKGISKSEVIDSGLPCVRYGEIYTIYNYKVSETASFVNEESASLSQAIEYGDVLFAGSGESAEEIGKAVTYIGSDTAYAGGDIIIFRPNEPQSGLFFGYYLNSNFINQQKSQSGQGHSVVHLYGKNVENIDVVIPNLKEQQKIAAILSKWDEAIEAQTQLIAAKETQKNALMQKLLTGEVRFPGFEEEWEEVTLNDICEFSNGKAHENIVDENGKYILITSKFISSNGQLCRRLNERLTPLKKDEIVMVMSDIPNGKALGKCFLIDEDNLYSLNQRIGRFKITNGHPKFIFFLLNRNQHFLQFDGGVSQTNLRKDDILECPLYIPSFPEQQKIASVLSSIDSEIETLKNELEALHLQKKGLMQELLTGKIRVKN